MSPVVISARVVRLSGRSLPEIKAGGLRLLLTLTTAMKTSRLAVPANISGGSHHRVFVPASRIGNRFSDLKPSHWIRRAAAVGLLVATSSFPASAVNLAWSPNPEPDIARYELSYGTSPGSRAVTVNAGLNTTASVTGLQSGVTYYFVVSAVNQAGLKSAPSAEISYLEPANQAPVAVSGSAVTAEDAPVSITLSASDKDSGSLTYAVVNTPGRGTLSGTAPNLIYTPSADYNGSDSFTFRANDGTANSNTATVSITITPVNDAPVAVSGSAVTAEDALVSITLSATDKDGGLLTYAIVNAPGRGTLSGTAPNLIYRPSADYNGSDSFTFRANDGTANSNTATVSITITPVNDAPVAVSGSAVTSEGAPVSITLSASDKDSGSLTYAVVNTPGRGTLSGTAPNLIYTPSADYNGSDSFTFRANDGTANSNTATVSITITPVNDAPVAVSGSAVTAEDALVSITLSATDKDGGLLTYAIVNAPGRGTLSGTAPNLIYRPSADYNGSDSFTFRANDGTANSNTATVSITITPVNDAPVAVSGSAATTEGAPVSIVLAATDKDGGPLSYAIVTGPGTGSLAGVAPNLTYTPAAGFAGADSFSFRAGDGSAFSNTATVSITVIASPPPSNIGPSFAVNPIVMTVAEDQALGGRLSATDPDEKTALTFMKLSGPSWLTVSSGGQLGGVPSNGDVGVNTFSVRVTDSANASASASLLVTVTNTNDAPVFTVNPINRSAGSEELPYSGESIAGTAADPDAGDVITFSKVSGPEWLVVSETGELSGTPPAGGSGTNTFIVRATDQDGATGDSVLQIQISASGLPLPWSVEDLAGSGGRNGASYDSGSFTLESFGRISGSSDAGCYVWQALSGDGMIIARVNSARSFDRNFLGGVMIRDSLASNSRQVFAGVDRSGGFRLAYRLTSGGRTRISGSGYGTTPKIWLALVRKDQLVSAYKSTDGRTWSIMGSVPVDLGENCYVGLVAGGDERSSSSATFSEVRVH